MPDLRASSVAVTHTGLVRDRNEDSWLALEERNLWAVADGMGGHDGGEWASAAVIQALSETRLGTDFQENCERLAGSLHEANRIVHQEALSRSKQMGTTAVVLYLQGSQFAVLWVGDSRAYLQRGAGLHQLSRDHTQVQELVESGALTETEAGQHPMRHVLTRAIGVADGLEVDVVVDEAEPGDTFLLSSDGLHACVEDAEIAKVLADTEIEAVPAELVRRTLDRGAPDNVTLIGIRLREPTLVAVAQKAELP